MPAWITETNDAVVLRVHVRPNAKRTEVAGTHGDALKIRLAAPPVDGRANEALIAFLAEAFGVPGSRVGLLSGTTGRAKRIRIVAPRLRPDRAWSLGR